VSTLVVYADTSDGIVQAQSSKAQATPPGAGTHWVDARAGAGVLLLSQTMSYIIIGHNQSVDWYDDDYEDYTSGANIFQGFYSFDTSSIGDGDSVSAAVFSIWPTGAGSVTRLFEARLSDWGTSLGTSDFITGANFGNYTLAAHYDAADGWSFPYVNFVDDALPANINKTGATRLVVCTSYFRTQTTNPSTTSDSSYYALSSDYAGTTSDPKLTVTYEAAVGEVYDGAGPTLDAWIVATKTGTFTANAVLKRSQAGSFTANATIKKSIAGSSTANAVIKWTQVGSTTAAATIKRIQAGSLTVNAVIKGSRASSLAADAIRLRTFWFGRAEDGF